MVQVSLFEMIRRIRLNEGGKWREKNEEKISNRSILEAHDFWTRDWSLSVWLRVFRPRFFARHIFACIIDVQITIQRRSAIYNFQNCYLNSIFLISLNSNSDFVFFNRKVILTNKSMPCNTNGKAEIIKTQFRV